MTNPFHVFAALALIGAVDAAPPRIEGATPKSLDHFGTVQTDWLNRLVELEDGSLVGVGFTNRDDSAFASDWNLFLRKYDAAGTLAWDRRLDRKGLDSAWTVRPVGEGRLAVAGFSTSGGAGGQDMHLALFGSAGKLEFEHWYGGPKDDRATDLLAMEDRGFLLVGQTESAGAGERDVLLVRTDKDGAEMWRRTYGTPGVDRGFFGALAEDGSALVAGITGTQGNYDFLLMKVAADGRLLWRRVVQGDGNDANHGLAVLGDGTIIFAGYGPSWAARGNDISLIRFNRDGQLLSHQVIGASGDDRVQFLSPDPEGGVWLTGYTKSFSDNWRALVARVGADGRFEHWLGAIGGAGDMNGSSISVARNGDLLLSGYSKLPSGGAAPADAFAMRIAPGLIEHRTAGVTVRDLPTSCSGTDQANDMICR